MPQVISTIVYLYDELPTEKAKEKALEWGRAFTADYDWWEYMYNEVKELGCEIKGFDVDRKSINFEVVECPDDVSRKIMDGHGAECGTYKTAKSFLSDRDALVEKYSDGIKLDIVVEENECDFDNDLEGLEKEFCKALGNDYLILLSSKLDYLTSEETLVENLMENEYTFTESGVRFG